MLLVHMVSVQLTKSALSITDHNLSGMKHSVTKLNLNFSFSFRGCVILWSLHTSRAHTTNCYSITQASTNTRNKMHQVSKHYYSNLFVRSANTKHRQFRRQRGSGFPGRKLGSLYIIRMIQRPFPSKAGLFFTPCCS